ncbi:MAG: hypothetical protein AAF502_16650 [Bacteroidota bacterium]
MKGPFLFLAIVHVLSGCDFFYPSTPDGHWHLVDQDIDRDEQFPQTLDIKGTEAILNNIPGEGGIHCRLDTGTNHLYIVGEGISYFFEWEMHNGKLLLYEETELDPAFIGIRCKKDHCNNASHWRNNTLVDTDPPFVQMIPDEMIVNLIRKSLTSNLYIGQPKEEFRGTYGDEPRLQMNGKFGLINEIPLFIEMEQLKIQPQFQSLMSVQIKADKDVQVKTLVEIEKILTEHGIQNIYYQLRTAPKRKYDKGLRTVKINIPYHDTYLKSLTFEEFIAYQSIDISLPYPKYKPWDPYYNFPYCGTVGGLEIFFGDSDSTTYTSVCLPIPGYF